MQPRRILIIIPSYNERSVSGSAATSTSAAGSISTEIRSIVLESSVGSCRAAMTIPRTSSAQLPPPRSPARRATGDLLSVIALAALFPRADEWLARRMGFALVSSWFFALAIPPLSFPHLLALVSLSRVELRSIAFIQKPGILEERLGRALAERKP